MLNTKTQIITLNRLRISIPALQQQWRSQTSSSSTATAAATEWEQAKPFTEMPTIHPLKLLLKFLPGGKYANLDSNQMMIEFKREFGPIVFLKGIFGKPDFVITSNPHDFEKAFHNQGIWPMRPGMEYLSYHRQVHRKDIFNGVEGLLGSQGEAWGSFRSVVNPVLMQPKNVHLYFNKMSQVNKEFMERIRQIRDPQTLEVPDNFEEEINRWTLESVSVVALDKQLGLINKNRDDPTPKRLFKALTEFFEASAALEFQPSIWKYIKTPTFKKAIRSLDEITEITKMYVDEAFERIEAEDKSRSEEKPESEKSVLEKLVKVDKQIALVMAMDMLMAGVDTTSSTFTGLLLCLAKNPEKQEKLREEVKRLLPQKDSEFNESVFKNMPYLRACIKESLRVYPLTVGNARKQANDVVISGYRVPKGTLVSMNSVPLLKDDAHYPRATEYLPERWLRPSKETEGSAECPHALKASTPFNYLPFGFGSRSCIGRRIAEMEMELGIARLIRNFHVEFNHPTEKAFKSLIISVPNIPLKFKFTDVTN
ncbi:cytochrome P450 CYP12A2 [Musca autumnalis]|uniref:cytochrome P450 CYP12A2 n=1 Tax=Musca autumnalis TaxID=221902 RepID=UPI003CF80272